MNEDDGAGPAARDGGRRGRGRRERGPAALPGVRAPLRARSLAAAPALWSSAGAGDRGSATGGGGGGRLARPPAGGWGPGGAGQGPGHLAAGPGAGGPGRLRPRRAGTPHRAARAPGARLDEELRLVDRPWLGCAPPDAEPLITVPWRFREEVVGFRLETDGRRVCLGLGSDPALLAEPVFQQLVHRCLCAAAGLEATPTLGVGLYGYGAIGREHAEAVAATEGLQLRRICDRSPERRATAET